jgi:hypothetical protein
MTARRAVVIAIWMAAQKVLRARYLERLLLAPFRILTIILAVRMVIVRLRAVMMAECLQASAFAVQRAVSLVMMRRKTNALIL